MSNVKMIDPLYQTDKFMIWEHIAPEYGNDCLVFEFQDDDVSHSFTIPLDNLTLPAFVAAVSNFSEWVGDSPINEGDGVTGD